MTLPYRSGLIFAAAVGLSACGGGGTVTPSGSGSLPAPARVGGASQRILSVGGPSCRVPTDYPTIQAAVDAAGCNTIVVAPGTYAENVVIARPLTLDGAQAGQDARTSRGSESVINGGGANLTINVGGVIVDGFTLDGPVSQGSASVVMMGGVASPGEMIENNVFHNPGRAASFNTSRTVFTRNFVNNTPTAGDGFQANSNPVQDDSIVDNNFGGANGAVYNADTTFIEGNTNISVTGNKSTGDGTLVALFKTNGATVSGNTVVGDSNSSAIYIGGGDSNVGIVGNSVTAAGSAVNVANGFGVGPNSVISITRNTLQNSKDGVKVGATAVTSAGTVVANRNRLTGNSMFGFENLSSFNQDGTCNWWGAKNGPGPVGPGSGDRVTTNVTFSPWLKSSDLDSKCNGRVKGGNGHGDDNGNAGDGNDQGNGD